MTARATRSLLILLAALPAFGALLLIRQYGVNFHFLDEWEPGIAGLLVRVQQHQFTLPDLFVQQNEHRQAVARILLLLTNPITHWNNFAVMGMGWLVVCATSVTLLALIRRTFGQGAPGDARVLLLWFLCNLLIFSPLQYETWLWGIGLGQWLLNLFVILSFWIVGSSIRNAIKLPVCLLFAVAATYSFGNGVMIWPLVAILLLASPRLSSKSKKWILIFWILACALSVGLYFYHFTKPGNGGERAYTINPLELLRYNLAYFGNAFSVDSDSPFDVPQAMTIGALLLAMFLAAAGYFARQASQRRRELCDRMLPWLVIGFYGILTGVAASFFRAGYGPKQAVTSRYVPFAIYIPISLIILVPVIVDDLCRRYQKSESSILAQLPAALIGAMLVLYVVPLPQTIEYCWQARFVRRQGKAELLLVDVLPDLPDFDQLVGVVDSLKNEADVLSDAGYLQPPLIRTNDADQIAGEDDQFEGHIDAAVNQGGQIAVVGWAINQQTMQPADGAFLTYDDPDGKPIIFAAARMYVHRNDLLQTHHDPIYQWCGWIAHFDPTQLPKNLTTVQISAWALDTDTARAARLPGVAEFKRQ
jgi:hypothetical protein